jgi:hypothetical protein
VAQQSRIAETILSFIVGSEAANGRDAGEQPGGAWHVPQAGVALEEAMRRVRLGTLQSLKTRKAASYYLKRQKKPATSRHRAVDRRERGFRNGCRRSGEAD